MKRKRRKRFSFESIEPAWDSSVDEEKKQIQLTNILNWYNTNYDRKKSMKWFLDCMEKRAIPKETIKHVRCVPDTYIPGTLGAVSRLILNESENLPKACEVYLDKTIKKLAEKGKVVYLEKKQKAKIPKKSVQDMMQEKLIKYLGHVDENIDKFVENECRSNFSLDEWLKSHDIKPIHAKKIGEYFKPLQEELELALSGKDEQLTEGYSHFKKVELKRLKAFMDNIVKVSSEYHQDKLSKKRRVRVHKTKIPSQLITKLQYLDRSEEVGGLTSESPRKIIGANQMWVYNTKYKILGVYYSADEDGFSVKGTTLQNFDEEKSKGKRLRKPNDIVPQIKNMGKVSLRNILSQLQTKEINLTGRINKDIILLRILK